MAKYCLKCDTNKDVSEFGKDKNRRDGLNFYCRECVAKSAAQYLKTEKGKKANRRSKRKYRKTEKGKKAIKRYEEGKGKLTQQRNRLRRDFGITLRQYDEMFENQNGVCAVCSNISVNERGYRLAVDHDHETGKIRGLLCNQCNLKLGILENKDWRSLAEKYLKSSLKSK